MKIYSANSVATVTLTTSIGFIATVGHFYRGEPLYIEGGIKVARMELSTKYDYLIGYTEYKKPSSVAFIEFDIGDRVIIRTDRGDFEVKITDVIPLGKYVKYKFEPRVIEEGDSGSPVIYQDNIVGYVTHINAFNPIDPIIDAITKIAKKYSNQNT